MSSSFGSIPEWEGEPTELFAVSPSTEVASETPSIASLVDFNYWLQSQTTLVDTDLEQHLESLLGG